MSDVGDLGRRVAEQRRGLGLTVEELAALAGMDPAYVHVLETNPAPQLPRSALLRLAAALETTVQALTGGRTQVPPGSGPAQISRPVLDVLGPDECRSLLRPGGVGRVVFIEGRGPVALPVNFKMLGDDVVFRTTATSALRSSTAQERVAFEVDHIDEALTEGWSVLISGHGHEVVDAAERAEVSELGVSPWAGGPRDVFVRIVPDERTGRRIRQRR